MKLEIVFALHAILVRVHHLAVVDVNLHTDLVLQVVSLNTSRAFVGLRLIRLAIINQVCVAAVVVYFEAVEIIRALQAEIPNL